MALIWYCCLSNRKCSIIMVLLIPLYKTLSFWLTNDYFSLRRVLFWATNLLQILHRNRPARNPSLSLLFSWAGFSVPAWMCCLSVSWKSHSCCWLLYLTTESIRPRLPSEALGVIFWDVELRFPSDLTQGKVFLEIRFSFGALSWFGKLVLLFCLKLADKAFCEHWHI